MRCLECNHALDGRTTRCPYCGGNVFGSDRTDARRDRAAEARSIWDEPRRSPKVVPLPERMPARWMLFVDHLLWAAFLSAGALWAGLAHNWATWVAIVIALACNLLCLTVLEASPWWVALWRLWSERSADRVDDTPDKAANM